jgi:hypothetical protein
MKKVCSRCGRKRRIGRFARDRSRVDGKRIYCRECISVINRNYRNSIIGRVRHKISVDTWKKHNKAAIREYNAAYYLRKRQIILYNKRCRETTEDICRIDGLDNKPKFRPKMDGRAIITINPQKRYH